MPTIFDAAKTHEKKQMKNIADLEFVRTDVEIVKDEERKDQNGETYLVSYVVINGEEYRVVSTVLEQLKGIIESKPELKTFQVKKTGEGKSGTRYQVIPLD